MKDIRRYTNIKYKNLIITHHKFCLTNQSLLWSVSYYLVTTGFLFGCKCGSFVAFCAEYKTLFAVSCTSSIHHQFCSFFTTHLPCVLPVSRIEHFAQNLLHIRELFGTFTLWNLYLKFANSCKHFIQCLYLTQSRVTTDHFTKTCSVISNVNWWVGLSCNMQSDVCDFVDM